MINLRGMFPGARVKSVIFTIMAIVAMMAPSIVFAQSVFDYPRKAGFIVIEYGQSHDMLTAEDKIPLLRIFGDGRVAVHYPVYMKRAGDYEMKISDAELQKLLLQLEASQVMTFDAGKLVGKVAAEKTRQAQLAKGVVSLRSDDTNTIIKVNLETYVPAASGLAQNGFRQTIQWKNLDWQAKKYSAVKELTGIALAEKILRKYLVHDGLVKAKTNIIAK